MNNEPARFHNRIAHLIYKNLTGNLPASELKELEEWVAADPINKELYNQVTLLHEQDATLSKPTTDDDHEIPSKHGGETGL